MLCYCFCINYTIHVSEPLIINIIVINMITINVFTINVFVRHEDSLKQLPIIQVVMSRRQKQDYSAVLQAVKDLLPTSPTRPTDCDGF